MSKREIDLATSSPSSLEEDDYEIERSRKRTKTCDSSLRPLVLQRRSSSTTTTFNMYNSNNAVVKLPPVSIIDILGRNDVIESREQWEERSGVEDETQEMRDMTESMRDMISTGGCTRMS